MTPYEIVVAIVQVFIMLALIIALLFTRGEYKARMRPYIGFGEIKMTDTDKSDEVEFEVNVQNVGQIPAKNAKLYGEFIVAGGETTPFECETKGSVFPSPIPLPIWVIGLKVDKEVDKDAILNGSKALQLTLTVDYYGSGKGKYSTSSSRTYELRRRGWINEQGNWK
jgi:hypothetical protein